MLVEVMLNFGQNEILPFICLCVFASEISTRENHVLCSIFLHLSHKQCFCPSCPFSTYQHCIVLGHMRNFSCCDGAMGHFNCDPGFIRWSAVLWKCYSVESYAHKETCAGMWILLWSEQYIAFLKRGFACLCSCNCSFFFFHFWIKRQPSVHHVPRRWSNVFLNAFSVIFQTFPILSWSPFQSIEDWMARWPSLWP